MIHLAKRFEAAVFTLVGDGPVKQRLGQAFTRHLEDVEESELPESLRQRFDELQAAMHSAAPIGKESSVRTTIQKMSFSEASGYAEAIVQLYAELLRNLERMEPLKIVRNEDSVPRYLTGSS